MPHFIASCYAMSGSHFLVGHSSLKGKQRRSGPGKDRIQGVDWEEGCRHVLNERRMNFKVMLVK